MNTKALWGLVVLVAAVFFVGGVYYSLSGGPLPEAVYALSGTRQEPPLVSAFVVATTSSSLTVRLMSGETQELPLFPGTRVITLAPEPPLYPIACLSPEDMILLGIKEGTIVSVRAASALNLTSECITFDWASLPPDDPSYVAP